MVSPEEKRAWMEQCQREKLARARQAQAGAEAATPSVSPDLGATAVADAGGNQSPSGSKSVTMTGPELEQLAAEEARRAEARKRAKLSSLEARYQAETDVDRRLALREEIAKETERLGAADARARIEEAEAAREAAEEAAEEARLHDAEAAVWAESKLAALKAWAESLEHAATALLLFKKYRGEETRARRAASRLRGGKDTPAPRPMDSVLEEIERRVAYARDMGKPSGASKPLLAKLGVK